MVLGEREGYPGTTATVPHEHCIAMQWDLEQSSWWRTELSKRDGGGRGRATGQSRPSLIWGRQEAQEEASMPKYCSTAVERGTGAALQLQQPRWYW